MGRSQWKPLALIPWIALLFISPAGAQSLDKALARLTADLLNKVSLNKETVAVGEFRDSQGQMTSLSSYISDRLEVELADRAKKNNFQILDRKNVAELAQEWKLGMYGYVNADTAVHAGKLLGVQVLCLGNYKIAGKKLTLHATFVNAESGQTLASASAAATFNKNQLLLSKEILSESKNPAEMTSENKDLDLEFWADRKEYKIGDRMKLSAKVNEDCYLTIIDIGTSGNATVLFPNLYAPGNSVKGGVTYEIPDAKAGFEFEVQAPPGVEIIKAIASKEPAVNLKDVMESFRIDAPFAKVKMDPSLLARDIHISAKKAQKGKWSEALLRLKIR